MCLKRQHTRNMKQPESFNPVRQAVLSRDRLYSYLVQDFACPFLYMTIIFVSGSSPKQFPSRHSSYSHEQIHIGPAIPYRPSTSTTRSSKIQLLSLRSQTSQGGAFEAFRARRCPGNKLVCSKGMAEHDSKLRLHAVNAWSITQFNCRLDECGMWLSNSEAKEIGENLEQRAYGNFCIFLSHLVVFSSMGTLYPGYKTSDLRSTISHLITCPNNSTVWIWD